MNFLYQECVLRGAIISSAEIQWPYLKLRYYFHFYYLYLSNVEVGKL